MRDGFDTARNAAIEEATGDWIMWLDCDEELVSPISLPAFMRNSGVTAYVMEQHHLSIEPAGTLTIDKPARVFRNRRGVKFYGVVHEHPEQKFGEGVGYATLLGWPKIAHTGYYTEEIRRKRFNRNFDLMQRDRYTYPDRVLGKYLWLRDCALMVSYIMERHGQLTQQGEAFAREGLRMYAELLKTKHLRFLTEGLTYYSTLNQVLGLGFEAEVTTMVRRPGGSTPQPQQLRGKFGSIADYKRLIELLTDEQTADIESRYF